MFLCLGGLSSVRLVCPVQHSARVGLASKIVSIAYVIKYLLDLSETSYFARLSFLRQELTMLCSFITPLGMLGQKIEKM